MAAVDSLFLLEPVAIPGSPIAAGVRQKTALGATVGLMLGVGVALLLEVMGDTVRSPEQLDRKFGVTALGTVGSWAPQEFGASQLVLLSAPRSSHAEGLRQIKANFHFATVNQAGGSILICSPGPGEGKSTLVANLGVALALSGKRTIIVDGDLRRPTLHKWFNVEGVETGLSNHLANSEGDLQSVVQATEVSGLDIVTSGPMPPNPGELLASPGVNSFLRRLEDEYDAVLVDTPPLLVSADGSILAAQAAGAIVVVEGSKTRSSELRGAIELLLKTQVHIVGVIINKTKRSGFGYGYPYYYKYAPSYYSHDFDANGPHQDGTGRLHRRLADRIKGGWSRIRGG